MHAIPDPLSRHLRMRSRTRRECSRAAVVVPTLRSGGRLPTILPRTDVRVYPLARRVLMTCYGELAGWRGWPHFRLCWHGIGLPYWRGYGRVWGDSYLALMEFHGAHHRW